MENHEISVRWLVSWPRFEPKYMSRALLPDQPVRRNLVIPYILENKDHASLFLFIKHKNWGLCATWHLLSVQASRLMFWIVVGDNKILLWKITIYFSSNSSQTHSKHTDITCCNLSSFMDSIICVIHQLIGKGVKKTVILRMCQIDFMAVLHYHTATTVG